MPLRLKLLIQRHRGPTPSCSCQTKLRVEVVPKRQMGVLLCHILCVFSTLQTYWACTIATQIAYDTELFLGRPRFRFVTN